MNALPGISSLEWRQTARTRVLPTRRARGYLPLLHRVAALNVLLVLGTVGVTVAVLSPATVSSFAFDEEVGVLLGAVTAVIAANMLALRRLVGPLQG